MGGFLDRETTKDPLLKYTVLAVVLGFEKYIPYLNAYFAEVRTGMKQYSPLLMGPAGNQACSADETWVEETLVGANLLDHGWSKLHFHADKPSLFPAAVTAMNPAGVSCNWSDGQLVLAEGGVELPRGFRDLVIVNGSQLHGVLPITPSQKAKCATRFSLVHFSRQEPKGPVYRGVPFMSGPVCSG